MAVSVLTAGLFWSQATRFCPRNGARETREKARKGMRGLRWEAHVTSRDPTLNAVGARSGVACPKNVQSPKILAKLHDFRRQQCKGNAYFRRRANSCSAH
jgi:hypothetical protein